MLVTELGMVMLVNLSHPQNVQSSIVFIESGRFTFAKLWQYLKACGPISVSELGIPIAVTSIGNEAFMNCWMLADVYCYIADLSSVSCGNEQFYKEYNGDYSGRTLHVLQGTADAYRADENWYPYFGQIVEDIFFGDVNRDLEVNIADVNAVIDIILGGNDDTIAADVNGDGEINIADINAIIDIILSGTQN